MLLLALDTAGPDCAVALVRAAPGEFEILASASESIGRGHAERLMPMIESALDAAGYGFGDIERVAVTIGPGSFTGVRVGIAAARGLALALGIPAIGIGTLDALALPILRGEKSGTAVAVLDAKRGELYALARDARMRATLLQPQAMTGVSLATRLRPMPEPLILTGSGAPILSPALAGRNVRIAGDRASPDIADVALLGLEAEVAGAPAPLYLRRADAKPQVGLLTAAP